MRRWFTLLCAALMVLAVPATGLAGKPFRGADHTVSITCDGVTGTSGSGFVFFGALVSDEFGPDAFIDAWEGSEPTGPPDITRDFEQPLDVTWDGTRLSGSIPLASWDGEPAGTATFDATLTPTGDRHRFSDSFRDGNRTIRFRGVEQFFEAEGTLELPSFSVDLAGCLAVESSVTTTESNPNAYIDRFNQRSVSCELSNGEDTGFLFVDLGDNELFVDASAELGDGTVLAGLFAGPPMDGSIAADLEVYDPTTGEPLDVPGSIELTATAVGDDFTQILLNATFRRTVRGTLLDIEGTLTLGGAVFDLGSCVGQDATIKEINTFPRGPKPGGKVPANDLPTGAKLLQPGGSATVQTKGASPIAEVPYECLSFTDPDTGEPFEVPVGHTVWYQFTGTGEPMTIDTAGSDFDTVVAIYTLDGEELVPVPDGCVDDSPIDPIGRTLQANVTIPTVEGTTYYVQVGGYPEVIPYGTLKVSLR